VTADTATRSLVGRHLGSGLGISILVAVLVAATVFVVALAPRALLRLGTDELRYELRREVPAQIDLSGDGPVNLGSGSTVDAILGSMDSKLAEVPARLPAPLSDGAGATRWLVRTAAERAGVPEDPTRVLIMKLAVDLHWMDDIRFVDGVPPVPWPGAAGSSEGDESPPVEIALSRATAEAMGVEVGDAIVTDQTRYLLAGTYDVVEPRDHLWQHERDLLEPAFIRDPGSPLKIQGSAFIAPDSISGLREQFSAGELSAWVPIDPEAYRYADASELGLQARKVTSTPVSLPDGGQLELRSDIDQIVSETQDKVAATSALIALTASGFVGVLIAAYALCIQAVIRRRRTILALASARGARPRQLRAVMMLEALLIVVPASLVAVGLAAAVIPEPVGIDGWLAPLAVALIPVVLAGALAGAPPVRAGRDDLASRWGGTSRWVVEVTVLGLAAVAVLLVQRRGLIASSAAVGVDPLLSAMPVLLAVAVGLLALRVYPIPLRAVHRAVRVRRAPAATVGSARAIRDPGVGLIGTLALVVGVSMAVFTTVMISTVGQGLRQSAHDQVGADLQVAAHDLPAELVGRLSELPGVTAAVALVSTPGVDFSDEAGPTEISVVLADTHALHQVRPDIPELTEKIDGRIPVLISSDWANRVEGTELHVGNSLAVQQGVIPADALPGSSRHWVLVDSSAAKEIGLAGQVPRRVLAGLSSGADPAAVAAEVTRIVVAGQPQEFSESVRVDTAEGLLAELRAAPITSGLESSLFIVSVASLLLTMLIVALSSLTAAGARNRVVGVLRVLGMTTRQIRSLVAWEFAPVAASAVIVGVGLGIALPYLVTTVLDLRGFFGGNSSPQPAIEPLWIASAVWVFIVAVVTAVAAATVAGRRLAPAGVLKMGEE
jgi:putative ABC transport system permease protein